MPKKGLTSYVKVIQSYPPLSYGAGGITEEAIACVGFSRAQHIINLGTMQHNTATSVTASVWESATSGGTYTLISGTLTTMATGGTSEAYVIDVPVSSTKVYQKCISTANDGWCAVGAVAVLYGGSRGNPPTSENTAVVV